MNNSLIQYRLQKAKESYQAAALIKQNKQWNFCINRLYYTCFYAAIALLLKHKITPKTHDGTRRQFSLHFIRSKKIDIVHGDLYSKLFNWRQKGDYGDMFDFKEEDVVPLFDPVHRFVATVEQIIQLEEEI